MTVAPPVVIVMGVSGSGKSTIGERLASELRWPFLEGDAMHPPENVAKMHAGTPLSDADRLPWLHAIAAWIDARIAAHEPGIVTCSALKRAYRDILVGNRSNVRLVFLAGEKSVIADRLAHRHDHFMPPALLDSQFAILEPPGADEHPITIGIGGPPEAALADIRAALHANADASNPFGKIPRGAIIE